MQVTLMVVLLAVVCFIIGFFVSVLVTKVVQRSHDRIKNPSRLSKPVKDREGFDNYKTW